MNWPVTIRNITIGAIVGGVLGLLAGLVLVALTDSIDNPSWAMSIGIAVGAASFPLATHTDTRSTGRHD